MSTPAILTVYAGRTAIGTLRDFGPGKCLACHITATGKHVSLGFHQDRRAAREAIEARHAEPPEPEAA